MPWRRSPSVTPELAIRNCASVGRPSRVKLPDEILVRERAAGQSAKPGAVRIDHVEVARVAALLPEPAAEQEASPVRRPIQVVIGRGPARQLPLAAAFGVYDKDV